MVECLFVFLRGKRIRLKGRELFTDNRKQRMPTPLNIAACSGAFHSQLNDQAFGKIQFHKQGRQGEKNRFLAGVFPVLRSYPLLAGKKEFGISPACTGGVLSFTQSFLLLESSQNIVWKDGWRLIPTKLFLIEPLDHQQEKCGLFPSLALAEWLFQTMHGQWQCYMAIAN